MVDAQERQRPKRAHLFTPLLADATVLLAACRTPLSAIIGNSEMMIKEIDEGGDVADIGAEILEIEGNAGVAWRVQ